MVRVWLFTISLSMNILLSLLDLLSLSLLWHLSVHLSFVGVYQIFTTCLLPHSLF